LSAPDPAGDSAKATAVLYLLAYLADRDYHFVSPTPATHRRVRDRVPAPHHPGLRDIFGWNRAWLPEAVDPELLRLMEAAGAIAQEPDADRVRSVYRISTIDGRLFAHSAPTSDPMAIFLGPDSYRYARFIRQTLGTAGSFERALDIGVGAGVGAVTLAALCPQAHVVATDINPAALRMARLNAIHAGLEIDLMECSGMPPEPAAFDVICANPPFIAGEISRIYRDGGGALGEALALTWVESGLRRLKPGGRFILYTGSAIVEGRDGVQTGLERLASEAGCRLVYEEIDPDIFGGSLRLEAYADVERIAAVGAVITAA
jgi:methylase of polypeptide subunit release factors